MPRRKTKPNRPPHGRTIAGDARIARMLPLVVAGMTQSQISAATGLSLRQVQRWICSDEIVEAVREARAEAGINARKVLEHMQSTAIAALTDVMNDPNEKGEARVRAALGWLDRSGLAPLKKHEHSGPGGKPIETIVHDGQPTSWADVERRALDLAERAKAEKAKAEAETIDGDAAGDALPASLEDEEGDDDGG